MLLSGFRIPYILWWYVLRRFLGSFGIALVACGAFMLMGKLLLFARDFESFGVTVGQAALLAPYLLPYALTYAVPWAAMIAAITVFGRLSAENEIQALQTSGAPLRMLLPPMFFCGAVLSVVCLFLNDFGIHWGFSRVEAALTAFDDPDFLRQLEKPGRRVSLPLEGPNSPTLRINVLPRTPPAPGKQRERRPIYVALFNGGRLTAGIYAEDHLAKQLKSRRKADHATIPLQLELRQARVLGEQATLMTECRGEFEIPRASIPELGLTRSRGKQGLWDNLAETRRLERTMPARRRFLLERAGDFAAQALAASPADPVAAPPTAAAWLDACVASASVNGARDRRHKYYVEFWRKLMLGLLPLSMIAFGVGLGLLVRKGHRLVGFLLGIAAYGGLYYPLMILGKETATLGIFPPAPAAAAPNVVLFALGWWLWRRSDRAEKGARETFFRRLFPKKQPASKTADGQAGDKDTTAPPPLEKLPVVAKLTNAAPLRRFFGRLLDRHLAVSFLVPFAVVTAAVSALFVALDLLEKGDQVVAAVLKAGHPRLGMPKFTTVEALLNVATYYVIRTMELGCILLPILLLLAGVLTTTALVRNNEHLLLKSSGISLRRMLRPILLIALLLSLAAAVVRETLLPTLIVERDRLAPLVYRGKPRPYTVGTEIPDADGKPLLVEMSDYDPLLRTGRRLRVYRLGEQRYGRIPMLAADRAAWDGRGWRLQTLKPTGLKKALAGDGKDAEPSFEKHGWFYRNLPEDPDQLENTRWYWRREPRQRWDGPLTPAFLAGERLGGAAMPLGELWRLREMPAFGSEFWQRLSDWLAGVLLLAAALPLLLRHETRELVWGVAGCILLAALYTGAVLLVVEAGRQEILPLWSVLLVHVGFGLFAAFMFYRRLET